VRWFRRRSSRGLEAAQHQVAESTARAEDELATSRSRLRASREVAGRLRLHNLANEYDTWIEQVLRGER